MQPVKALVFINLQNASLRRQVGCREVCLADSSACLLGGTLGNFLNFPYGFYRGTYCRNLIKKPWAYNPKIVGFI